MHLQQISMNITFDAVKDAANRVKLGVSLAEAVNGLPQRESSSKAPA